jgi:hypothetical protein
VTTDQGDHDQGRDDEGPELPEHPETRQAETVQALEDQQTGGEPDDEEQVRGDEVSESPDDDEMEGLPGPPPGEPDEPSG